MGNLKYSPPTGNRIVTLPREREGETPVYRSSLAQNKLVERLDENVTTLFESFKKSVDEFPNKRCLGYREGDGPYKWLSYKTTYARARNVGCGLIELGIKPKQDFVGIYSVNRLEWTLVEQACNCYSFCLVPLYDTLGPEAVSFIVNEAELPVVVCSADKTNLLLESNCKSLRIIVQMGELTLDNKEKAEQLGIKLISMTNLETLGSNNLVEVIPPTKDDLCTICYTSGTTGNPKGVMLTHANLIAELAGIYMHGIEIQESDVHLSYLPLAHVFERMIMIAILSVGASAGYFRGNITQLFEDIQELKPTVFPSVPRLFNKLFDRVMQAAKVGGIKETLFFKAYDSKIKSLENGYVNDTLWDTVVFGKVAEKLGGRVRFMVTGSAPINKEVLEFLRIAFSCPVYEGYGQTETSAGATITMTSDLIPGHVGIPLSCIEYKLVDIPDMNYFTTDQPLPRGEICFRGPNCTQGYYKNEEKTRELIDEHGWLHTGDVGAILEDGSLKIIDRKKNIFKLNQGEYVAPEKLELIFAKSPLIAQIFVYGDSLKSKLIAIVVPDVDVLKVWAKEKNIPDSDNVEALCKNQLVYDAILEQIQHQGKDSNIRGFERIHAIHVTHNAFTVENDLLTPTFKLKRQQAKQLYQKEIDEIYERIGDN